jgi:hypothetical protein
MRLWSLHPKYLDTKGLVALWREGLLAQAVLLNKTKGYKNHPQLDRFKSLSDPIHGMSCYLDFVANVAQYRSYSFDYGKVVQSGPPEFPKMTVTKNQLIYEARHLQSKLVNGKRKNDVLFLSLEQAILNDSLEPHPLFKLIDGPIESWEKVK